MHFRMAARASSLWTDASRPNEIAGIRQQGRRFRLAVDEPNRQHFFYCQRSTREHQLFGPTTPDESREKLRTAVGGQEPELDFG